MSADEKRLMEKYATLMSRSVGLTGDKASHTNEAAARKASDKALHEPAYLSELDRG